MKIKRNTINPLVDIIKMVQKIDRQSGHTLLSAEQRQDQIDDVSYLQHADNLIVSKLESAEKIEGLISEIVVFSNIYILDIQSSLTDLQELLENVISKSNISPAFPGKGRKGENT